MRRHRVKVLLDCFVGFFLTDDVNAVDEMSGFDSMEVGEFVRPAMLRRMMFMIFSTLGFEDPI